MSIDMKIERLVESASTCELSRSLEKAHIPCADTVEWMWASTDQMLGGHQTVVQKGWR